MALEIISREEWGAQHPDGFYARKVGNLEKWLHHSAMPSPARDNSLAQDIAEMRKLERIGQERFGGGISYTFVIMPSGRVFEGHGIGRVGSHTGGRNSISAGLCLHGNTDNVRVTVAAETSLRRLLERGVDAGWWTSAKLDGGHSDVRSTACPGKDAYARVIGAVNETVGHVKQTPAKSLAQKSPKGKSVQQLASEIRAGKHGNGHQQRRASLGVDAATYERVRAEVNRQAGIHAPATRFNRSRSLSDMATEVLQGKHGNGHQQRRASLGVDAATYERVRAEVNRRMR